MSTCPGKVGTGFPKRACANQIEQMVELVQAGLATAAAERIMAGKKAETSPT